MCHIFYDQCMLVLRLKIVLLLIITAFATIWAGNYLFNDVFPYHFSQQWKPTAENLNTNGEYDPSEEIGEYLGQVVHSTNLTNNPPQDTQVLGDSDSLYKHIEVDLTNQKVYAFEGTTKVMEFLVSTGKWNRTPTGHFTIQYKTLAQKMSGGNRALGTYYYLPNVQFVQFFGNDEISWGKGYSFHGAYWHDNFGHPMSHGCINMRNEDAEKLFYWTTPNIGDKRIVKTSNPSEGTPVFIYGQAPLE